MDLNKAIKARHSVRKFKEKRPDWRDIIDSIETARYAPMAGNNFSLKFIVVDDENKIEKVAAACQQQFVGEAKYLVVVCSATGRTTNAYEESGKVFLRQQAGAAIQNFLLNLEEKGLATCWVGYFVEDIIKRELKIPETSQVEAVFPIGFEFDKKHLRQEKADLDSFLYFNSYGNKRQKPLKKFDV
jgi:nitroreductase